MTNVKPCPFCGRVPIIEDCGEHRWFIRCACGIAQDKLYAQRCDAVRRWNRRKTEPQTAPSAESERMTGKWQEHKDYPGLAYLCSECGYFTTMRTDFCPNCGARMEE